MRTPDATVTPAVREKKTRISDMALRRMAALLEGLATAPRLDETCEGAVNLLKEIFGFPYIEIFEVRPEDAEIAVLYCTQAEAEFLTAYRQPASEGILGHVARTGQTVTVPDAAHDSRFVPCLRDSRSELAVPIRVGGEVRYILNVESRERGAFERIDRGLIETLAGIIGAAFRLAEEMEKREAFQRRTVEERDAARDIASALQKENLHFRRGSSEKIVFQNIITVSPAMQTLLREMEAVRDTTASVLIEGETGTGKELLARTLHQIGPRRSKPFVVVNAANLQAQLFESELFGYKKGSFSGATEDREGLAHAADGGTLFLDEVGELSLENQAKVLRFLDYKEVRPVGATKSATVDVRIIAATNRNLAGEVQRKAFREDLYYRLRVIHFKVPSLRERREDLPLLILHFLETYALRDHKRIPGIAEEAMDLLLAYPWKGNVREIKNELQRIVALTPPDEKVSVSVLSPEIRAGRAAPGPASLKAAKEAGREREREAILAVLEQTEWNVSKASSRLGITRVGLTKKLKNLGLRRPS